MKNRIWIVAGGVVVLMAAAVVGPEMRFQRAIVDEAKAYEANGGSWPQLSDACVVCHGQNGDSVNQKYADLAGQPAAYIAGQLHAFADGRRSSPFMAPLALSLADADIRHLSEYFARQAVSNNVFQPDATLRARGESLSKGCTACHGDRLMGDKTNPRLAGQGYDYLLTQMDAYAANTRADATGAMNALAAALSQDDRRAVATYMASYPVTARSVRDDEVQSD
jgi:cytochrome c553